MLWGESDHAVLPRSRVVRACSLTGGLWRPSGKIGNGVDGSYLKARSRSSDWLERSGGEAGRNSAEFHATFDRRFSLDQLASLCSPSQNSSL